MRVCFIVYVLFFQYLAKRLAGMNVSEMTCFVLGETWKLLLNQSDTLRIKIATSLSSFSWKMPITWSKIYNRCHRRNHFLLCTLYYFSVTAEIFFLCTLYYFSLSFGVHYRIVDALCKVISVSMTDLSQDTGIHVTDIIATMQSLGLITVNADNHRWVIFIICFIKSYLSQNHILFIF